MLKGCMQNLTCFRTQYRRNNMKGVWVRPTCDLEEASPKEAEGNWNTLGDTDTGRSHFEDIVLPQGHLCWQASFWSPPSSLLMPLAYLTSSWLATVLGLPRPSCQPHGDPVPPARRPRTLPHPLEGQPHAWDSPHHSLTTRRLISAPGAAASYPRMSSCSQVASLHARQGLEANQARRQHCI